MTVLPDLVDEFHERLAAADPPSMLAARIRSKLLTTGQLADIRPPEAIVGGLLYRDSLATLYGPSGSGKSHVVIDLAMTLASDLDDWHGVPITTGDVLYVVAEGVSGVSLRTDAWQTAHGTDGRVTWYPEALALNDSGWVSALCEVVAEMRPALIVIDTLARAIVGADESSARDIGEVIHHLDRIRIASDGACVLLVHHSGKQTSAGARGSSALRAAMTTELELTGNPDDRMTLYCRKQKDAPETTARHFKLIAVAGTKSAVIEPTSGRGTSGPDAAEATLAALEGIAGPEGVTSAAWKAAAGRAARTFFRHREALCSSGRVVDVGTKSNPLYRPAASDEH